MKLNKKLRGNGLIEGPNSSVLVLFLLVFSAFPHQKFKFTKLLECFYVNFFEVKNFNSFLESFFFGGSWANTTKGKGYMVFRVIVTQQTWDTILTTSPLIFHFIIVIVLYIMHMTDTWGINIVNIKDLVALLPSRSGLFGRAINLITSYEEHIEKIFQSYIIPSNLFLRSFSSIQSNNKYYK